MNFDSFSLPSGLRAMTKLAAIAGATALAGCTPAPSPFFGEAQPTLVAPTQQSMALRTLPSPIQRMNVAVYDFPDLTGQYEERELVQSLSRAVSQGGSAVLIKALQDAGEGRWFSVLDRASLPDLVRERQILTEMRRQYRGEDEVNPAALGPLLHAGIILQGGIVGYDSNTQTGGAGARLLGVGANSEWRTDTVTVSLRAVSTSTGEVLTNTMAQKSIGSSLIQGSIFSYIELDELLEVEAGMSANEPRLIALQQAIEKAVYSMIIEGAEKGIWSFSDKATQSRLIAKNKSEKLGAYSAYARLAKAPQTRNPASITQTVPKKKDVAPASVVRELTPETGAVRLPTPPVDDEVLG
ncbi:MULTISPECIES: CsgG/HfaB family protein [Falsihalocynthiibacter]|uniref:CsgG/HfaB family protein n=1 Tax=Falsihalocynthiibacter TaxID=2854182 RepID=UPI00300296C9